jgi:hypothetical protein
MGDEYLGGVRLALIDVIFHLIEGIRLMRASLMLHRHIID